MRGKRIAKIVIAALVVVAGAYVASRTISPSSGTIFTSRSRSIRTPKKTVWLDQGVSQGKAELVLSRRPGHADLRHSPMNGSWRWSSRRIPWLIFTKVDHFSDTDLSRSLRLHSRIPSSRARRRFRSASRRAARCWIRRARRGATRAPRTDMTGIGLTCAACHTGRFTYKDTAVVIDGGPALTDLFKMKQGMGVSLLLTRLLARPLRPVRREHPGTGLHGRRPRGAEGPARPGRSSSTSRSRTWKRRVASQSILEGYGRLDAINRIGNQGSSIDLKKPENYAGSSAPVHYPPDLEHAVVRLGAV